MGHRLRLPPLLWAVAISAACLAPPGEGDPTGDDDDASPGDDDVAEDLFPTVAFAAPSADAVLSGTVEIGVDAADDRGIARVEVHVDGGPLLVDETFPYGGTWDTATYTEGSHTLRATAVDDASQATPVEIVVRVDHTPPAVGIAWPPDGGAVSGVVEVAADAVDAHGIAAGSLLLDGVQVAALDSFPATYDVDTAALARGPHTIEVRAWDPAGNEGSAAVAVDVDNPPWVEIASPADGASVDGTVEVAVEAGDDEGVVSVVLSVDGVEIGASDEAPHRFAVGTCDLEEGAHTLRAMATDAGGGTGEATSTVQVERIDLDGDGASPGCGDCDDGDPDVAPGSVEVCGDGRDNDCDGTGAGCRLGGLVDASAAVAKLTGEGTWQYAGASVAAPGDVDGDGQADLVVGAEAASGYAPECGVAYVVRGPVSGTLSLADAWLRFEGAARYDNTGGTVAGAGDLDGDGRADVLVGADAADPWGSASGAAYAVTAAEPGVLDAGGGWARYYGGSASEYAGSDVASGDLDGDGRGDVVVGAFGCPLGGSGSGCVYVVLSPEPGTVDLSTATADAVLVGIGPNALAGVSVASGGDLDGDGIDDLAVGSMDHYGGTGTGRVHVVLGGSLPAYLDLGAADGTIAGAAADDHAGVDVSIAGDVDGDGYDDLLIGAPFQHAAGTESGGAYLVLGPALGESDLSTAAAWFKGGAPGDLAGQAVAIVPDLDGDGYDEVLVGAPGADAGGSGSGAAYLFYGPVAGTLDLSAADARLVGENAGDDFGGAVAAGGDLDGDGLPDLLIGAQYANDAFTDAGTVYVMGGVPGM
ncbi:Ig-like domain-containing protein [Myxococcota bacterium]|nr:Ig-like domain-containing protein [Myxococcota bacterium]